MTAEAVSLDQAARRLTRALRDETALARVGALPDLAAAAFAKQEAFEVFQRVRAATPEPPAAAQAALRVLAAAGEENALVLEAVRVTLEHTATRLRHLLSARADPGIYGRQGRAPRHVLAAQLDAKV